MTTHTESKSAFTPGPWSISEGYTAHGFTDNDGGIPIMAGEGDDLKRIGTALLTKQFPRGKTYKAQDPERDANARLFAASKDLYAALTALIAAAQNSNCDSAAIDSARAALSRTTA